MRLFNAAGDNMIPGRGREFLYFDIEEQNNESDEADSDENSSDQVDHNH